MQSWVRYGDTASDLWVRIYIFLADRRAVTAVEYAIIAGVMAAALVASVTTLGGNLSPVFNKVAAEL